MPVNPKAKAEKKAAKIVAKKIMNSMPKSNVKTGKAGAKVGKYFGPGAKTNSGSPVMKMGAPLSFATGLSMPKAVNKNQTDFEFFECIGPNVANFSSGVGIGGLLKYGDLSVPASMKNCNWDFTPSDVTSFGTRVTNEALNWEFFRITKLNILWVPVVGATNNGQILIAYDYDPLGATPPEGVEGYRQYAQFQNVCSGSVWEPFEMAIQVTGDKLYPVNRFFTDNNKTSDPRQSIQGQLYVVNGGGLTVDTLFGNLWIKGTCKFSERSFKEPALGVGIQSVAFDFPTAGAANQNALTLAASYTAKNPPIAQVSTAPDGGKAIFLTPGTYLAENSSYIAPSTSNSAGVFQFTDSELISPPTLMTGEAATIIEKQEDYSTAPVSATAASYAAQKQEIINVPYGGTYYRPKITSPAYVGTANDSYVTLNLTQLASSAISFLKGLFDPPPARAAYSRLLKDSCTKYFAVHGNMIGYEVPKFVQTIPMSIPDPVIKKWGADHGLKESEIEVWRPVCVKLLTATSVDVFSKC